MRTRSVALVSLSVLLLGRLSPGTPAPATAATRPTLATAATPPTEFGSDYDDPRTPAPPVAVPQTKHCEVQIGTQTVRYRAIGPGCYDHTLGAVNGVYTKDFYRC